MGDFSFASRVYTHGDADCGVAVGDTSAERRFRHGVGFYRDRSADPGGRNGHRYDDDHGGERGERDADNSLTAARHLCIMVQGVDDESEDGMVAPRIPETDAYTAMGSYTGIEDAAIGPVPQEQTLGIIKRNGTTIHLPYLTTNAKFNQRLYIVNRGAEAVYEMGLPGGRYRGRAGQRHAGSRTPAP